MSFMVSNQVLNGIKNYMMDIVLNQHPSKVYLSPSLINMILEVANETP